MLSFRRYEKTATTAGCAEQKTGSKPAQAYLYSVLAIKAPSVHNASAVTVLFFRFYHRK